MQVGSLLFSAAGVAVGVAIPAKSGTTASAKIAIVFGTICLEMLATPVQIFLGWVVPINCEVVADRYATLSLMIM